ncbi:MAG: hypothetical protein ACO1TE_19630 [Prosthecobacter sp.]
MSLFEPTNDAAPAEAPAPTCVNCGSLHLSGRTKLPLCEPCRAGLVKFPFPLWVRVSAVVVAVMVCGSLALSREHISGALRLKHAEKMMREERWEEAFQGYQELLNKNKDKKQGDTDMMLACAEAAKNSGHYEEAARMLDALSGRKATKMEVERADSLGRELGYLIKQSQPQAPQAPLPFTGAQFLPSVLR